MVVGYKFQIEKCGQAFWVYLRGNGGKIGAGSLHVQDAADVNEIARQLLRRSRVELRKNGQLRAHVETPGAPYSFTSIRVTPDQVLACRPVFSRRS